MSQSFIKPVDNGPHSALSGLGVLTSEQPRYVRKPEADKRFSHGDDFAGDAWLDAATGQTVYSVVGFDRNAGVGLARQPHLKELLDRYERAAWRMGELWERCQGKGWPDAESTEFTELRDERLPALRAELNAACGVRLDEGMSNDAG